MRRLLQRLLLLALLATSPAWAVFYCVEETNTYDAAGTANADLATACGTSGGFGWASNNAAAGDVIAIIHGTNSYNSGTSSWTNRPAAKSFECNVGTGCSAGAAGNPIKLIGYADTSTSCLDSPTATNCPVHLDFATGTGDGLEATTGGPENWVIAGLWFDNAATDAIDWPGNDAIIVFNKATGFGSDGITNSSSNGTFVGYNLIDGESTATGIGINVGNNNLVMFNRVEDMDSAGSAFCFSAGNEASIERNIAVNCGVGVSIGALDKIRVIGNTIKDCTDDCVQAINGSFGVQIIGNIIQGAVNDGVDLCGGAGACENYTLLCNQYDNNGTNKNTSSLELDLFEITATAPLYDAADTDLTLTNPQVCAQIASAVFGPGTNEELDLPIGAAFRDEDLPGGGAGGGAAVLTAR